MKSKYKTAYVIVDTCFSYIPKVFKVKYYPKEHKIKFPYGEVWEDIGYEYGILHRTKKAALAAIKAQLRYS